MMEKTARLLLFGGSFDPVHEGHLAAARFAQAQLAPCRVLFMPAATPPHKGGLQSKASDRLNMLRLATAGQPDFLVSDMELLRGGVSYSIDTVDGRRQPVYHPPMGGI